MSLFLGGGGFGHIRDYGRKVMAIKCNNDFDVIDYIMRFNVMAMATG